MNKALTYCALLAIAAAATGGCGHGDGYDAPPQDSAEYAVEDATAKADTEAEAEVEAKAKADADAKADAGAEDYVQAAEMLHGGAYRDRVPSEWTDSMPDDGCVKMKVRFLPGGPLARVFNDSNYVHYAEAQAFGITPVMKPSDVLRIKRPIVAVHSCDEFIIDSLRYSYPYLIPEAAKLLRDIGARFNAEQKARGGGHYRLKVTSLLRTQQVVRRLRRVNRIAVDSSAHRFGTTFDISYVNFYTDRRGGVNRTQEDLKNLLAEILYDMRQQGRCYIKYERKQGCFHITARDTAARRPRPTPPPKEKKHSPKK